MDILASFIKAPKATGPLGPVVTFCDTAIRLCSAVILWITFFCILTPTFVNAVLRYTTNASLDWSVEIVQLTFPWFIMSGAVLAAQHSRHISVHLLASLLPLRFFRIVSIINQVIIFIACFTVCYVYLGLGQFEGGMDFVAGDVSFTSLGVAQSWSYLALLVGYILLGVTAITTFYNLLTNQPINKNLE